ncbi:MAG: hypothetical protein A2Z34_02300 [Planctomycetes bacterium RBG_16_59_8]|nr:MAG: hypothetical protein A2Z34_02300 [Planctomycetes bacterium RBG_16_59_8]
MLGVKGDEEIADDLTIVWTFVVNGNPPQVGITVAGSSAIDGKLHAALPLIQRHGEFTLNVPTAEIVVPFDKIDMCASKRMDKFAYAGLTRAPSKTIGAPGIEECPIILECRVTQSHPVPPKRILFVADVLRTTVHEGVCDRQGRLIAGAARIFGMTAGCGEFHTLGERVGHIGQTVGRTDIRY